MKYVLWLHDPCYEGGWRQQGSYADLDLAIQAAKQNHGFEMKDREEMRRDIPEYEGCYDGAVITSEPLWKLDAPWKK